jgi:hypothetical protein
VRSPGRRFQIHLSTAIMLMFAAGGLIWANFMPQRYYESGRIPSPDVAGDIYYYNYGWPLQGAFLWDHVQYVPPARTVKVTQSSWTFRGVEAAFDIFIGIVVIFAVWLTGESWIVWRRNQKEIA